MEQVILKDRPNYHFQLQNPVMEMHCIEHSHLSTLLPVFLNSTYSGQSADYILTDNRSISHF